MEANLLVTFDPSHKGKAMEEVKGIMEDAGVKAKFLESVVDGIFLIKVDNPKDAVRNITGICQEDPSKFSFTNKWIPVEKWVSSNIETMKAVMKEIDAKMDAEESWKLDLGKRQYDALGTSDLIMELTDNINKPKVDLKNPQKIVKVEIIGNMAGVSLLNPSEFLDVNRIKKSL
jgi:tRNA acetyltransferase TAN1